MADFRQYFLKNTPSWQHEGEGGLVLYSLMLLVDLSLLRVRRGFESRFPSRAGDSALRLIGDDRGILRGRTEVRAHYAERLKRWRYPRGHRVRGSAFAALEQISEYFGGVSCWGIDTNSCKNTRTLDGVESFEYKAAPFEPPWWNWDNSLVVYRFWDVIEPPAGFTYTLDDVNAIRGLYKGSGKHPWKPSGTRAEWLIVAPLGVFMPDGNYRHWSRNIAGVQTPTRDKRQQYWSLTPDRNNIYAGNPANFPTSCIPLAGGTYSGDPTKFPLSLTLPKSGATYAGNPVKFPSAMRLLDDGDLQ